MTPLDLNPTHRPVQNFYTALKQFEDLSSMSPEKVAVKSAFHGLLDHCARQHQWILVRWEIRRARQSRLVVDGGLLDNFRLTHGYWEAKNIHDIIAAEIEKVIDALASQSFSRAEFLKKLDRLWYSDTTATEAAMLS